MLRLILIFIATFLLIRIVFRMFFMNSLKGKRKKDMHVEHDTERKSRYDGQGEYIDYEEIKE